MAAITLCDILYIEDNDDDAYFFQRAFEQIPCEIHVVQSFADATQYLKGEGPFAHRASSPLPNLIIADLARHIDDGIRFLEWLRNEPPLSGIRVICFSAVLDPFKIKQISQLTVTCVPKTGVFDDLLRLIRSVLPI